MIKDDFFPVEIQIYDFIIFAHQRPDFAKISEKERNDKLSCLEMEFSKVFRFLYLMKND